MTDRLDKPIPTTPTDGSVNQRLKAVDELTESGGAGDLAAIKTKTDDLNFNAEATTEVKAEAMRLGTQAKADVEAECGDALTAYDPPTRTEATADKDAIITEVNANETKIDTMDAVVDEIPSETNAKTWNATALAAIQSECNDALVAYDPPTRAEATADKDAIITEVNANETKIDTVDTVVDTILVDTADMQPKVDTINTRVDQSLSTTESNIRGSDSDDLKVLSDQLDSNLSAIQAIQNNTRFTYAVPKYMSKPDAGNEAFKWLSNLYDSIGNLEDPDNNEILVRVMHDDGTYITANLYKENALTTPLDNPTNTTDFPPASGWRAMEREATGKFFMFYKVSDSETEETLTVEFGYEESSVVSGRFASTEVADVHGDLAAILVDTDDMQSNGVKLNAQGKLDVNAEVDSALNTAIPGSPTADSINERVKALDTLLESGGSGDAAAIKTAVDNINTGFILSGPINLQFPDVDYQASAIEFDIMDANDDKVSDPEITAVGTIDIYRFRTGTDATWQTIVSGGALSKTGDGSVAYSYNWPNASWAKGDCFRIHVQGVQITLGSKVFQIPRKTIHGIVGMAEFIQDLLEAPTEANSKTFNATALASIEAEVTDAIEADDLDHLLKLDGATQKYPENCATDSIIAKIIAKGDPADPSTFDNSTDSLEALSDKIGTPAGASVSADLVTIDGVVDDIQDRLDGTTSTPNAYRRETGVRQVVEKSITNAANAGLVTVGTITSQPCLVKSLVIHANAAQTGDMTSCAVKGGVSQVVEFIGAGDAIQANLDAADKQVSWYGAVRHAATKTIVIDLQGTGATAVDLTITIEYEACVDGGYIT